MDLFLEESEEDHNNVIRNILILDHNRKIEDVAGKTRKAVLENGGPAYDLYDIRIFISQLILANYCGHDDEMAKPRGYALVDYRIHDFREAGGIISYHDRGQIRVHSHIRRDKNIRVLISVSNDFEELQSLTMEMIERLLPVEKIADYMLEHAIREYKR